MRVAVLSDIHGNMVALDAALADVRKQGVDQVWCGGDLAMFGPRASDCIDFVRTEGWPTVRGNTDVWITGDPQGDVSAELKEEIRRLAEVHAVSDDQTQWLLNLPVGHPAPGSVLLVHATPESPFVAPLPDEPGGAFQPYEGKAQLVIYAHVHEAFVRRLKDGTIVANTGSVGLPSDGPTGSYLLVDLEGPDMMIRIQRFEFDRDAAMEEARAAGDVIADAFASRFS